MTSNIVTLYERRRVCLASIRGNLLAYKATKSEMYLNLAIDGFKHLREVNDAIIQDRTITLTLAK